MFVVVKKGLVIQEFMFFTLVTIVVVILQEAVIFYKLKLMRLEF